MVEAEFSLGMQEHSHAFELPIVPNCFGFTSLDYCLPGAVYKAHFDREIFYYDKT